MIRSFDLSTERDLVAQCLNNAHLRLISCKVIASRETGYTTATLRMEQVADPIERKRQRRLERFVLFAGANQELDKRMSNPDVILLKQFEFTTESGVIIVIDFETREERS